MLPYGVGVKPDTPWIRDVIRHEQTGFLIDPRAGVIYGKLGKAARPCADGYVRLGGGGSGACWYAHRLIWEVVNGAIPHRFQIDHINGRKADNRIRNLDAVSQSENILRALANGLMPCGQQRSDAKLTDASVREIRRAGSGVSDREWARRLGVDSSTVRLARLGKTWRHVPMRSRARSAAMRTTRRSRRRR